MKTAGIIAEYNPLHNGHLYHIEKTKELTGADYLIVVMSGDFVQRGAPAIYDKYTRTVMALKAGADLVLELPSIFAVSSAEDFAGCAVALLDRLGVVDSLCFGSESGDIRPLSGVADILVREPLKYTETLKNHLKNGRSFPEARSLAVGACLPASGGDDSASLLDTPNNILGIEYLKALKRRNSSIIPFTIPRAGSNYHDDSMAGPLPSATAIRNFLFASEASSSAQDQPKEAVPDFVHEFMETCCPVSLNDFTDLLNYTLLLCNDQGICLSQYSDVSEELAARIHSKTLDFLSFEERIADLKTRQYTYTRISRALLHLILQIKTEDVMIFRQLDYAPYARVLGFRRASSKLLGQIKRHSDIPLITKTADAGMILSDSSMKLLNKDHYCSHLYQSVLCRKSGKRLKNEYTQSCCIL